MSRRKGKSTRKPTRKPGRPAAAPSASTPRPEPRAHDSRPHELRDKPALEIRDRSGKVHQVFGRAKGRAAPGPAAPAVTEARSGPRVLGAPGPKPSEERTPWEPRSDRDRNRRREGRKLHDERGRDERGRDNRGERGRDQRGERGRDQRGERGRRRDGGAGGERAQFESGQKFRATVDKNRKGFGFLIFEDRSLEDAFVPPGEAARLFHGDRVEVTVGGRGAVQNVTVLEHRFRELVGRFSAHPNGPGYGGWVVYERKRAREEVFVPRMTMSARNEDWVRARLEFHESGPFAVTAEITQVYGAVLPASADIGMVAAEYNLVEAHTPAAESEARDYGADVDLSEVAPSGPRRDLRGVAFITIDGETARDFDDAVFVERRKSGFMLWVAIADVSHYVTPGTALDRDSRSRGTSVYFPERAFHMLPRALSENLCSLKPNVPRLSLAARMEFDRDGRRESVEVMEAVIESRRRATYEQIQAEHESSHKNPAWEFAPHFELYRILRRVRSARGSIDFDLPESEVRVDPDGEVLSITRRGRLDSHRLIEEFMIAANEAVTAWMMERSWPFVYRIHDVPAMDALERFEKLASNAGIRVAIARADSPKVIAEVVSRLEGHPAQTMLNMALLRSMKQAVYSSVHGIHFGLASEGYTHFTSPIRRYPDLIVHRLLRRALRTERGDEPTLTPKLREKLEQELADICEHCSYRERLASDAEREATRLKQVRILLPRLGDEFEGKVNGMVDAGLFVQLDEPYVEGMLPKESITDDFYEFDKDKMLFIGRRRRRTFRIGDRVRVRLVRADLDQRQLDFGLLEHQGSREASAT